MKIISQLIAGVLIYFLLNIKLTSFYGLFYDSQFPPAVGILLTLFLIIIVTNSFNLIDGIDGLAATFALVALMFFGTWFHFANDDLYSLACFSLAGGVLGFLFMNWEPSKIFMGDTGSLVLGMVLSILLVRFLNVNYSLPSLSPVKFQSSVGAAICVLIIPLTDTIRIIILRISKKTSPFTPDKQHIHHALVRLGKSHRFAVSMLCLVHLCFISLAIVGKAFTNVSILGITIASATALCLLLDKSINNRRYR